MTQSAQNVRRAGSLAAFGVVTRIIAQAMALILLILAGRFLTLEMFGVFALSVILVNFSQTMLYSGVYNFVLKEPGLQKVIGTAFLLHILTAVFFSVLTLIVGGIIWYFAPTSLLAKLIFATVPLPLVALIGCWQEAITLRKGSVGFYYSCMLVTEIAAFTTGATLLINGFGVWSLIASRYVLELLRCIILTFSAGRVPVPAFAKSAAIRIRDYSAGLYGSSGLVFFYNYYADIVIGFILSDAAVGLFRMGTRMATAAFDIIAQPVRILAWQAFGRLAREERIDDPVWVKIFAVTFTVMTAALGSMALLGEDLIYVVLDEKWLPMVPILQAICVVRAIASFDLVVSAHIMAADRSNFVFKARLGQVLVLGVSITGAVFFGAIAVAMAMIPAAIFMFLVLLREICRLTNTKVMDVWKTVQPGLIIALGTIATAGAAQFLLDDMLAFYRLIVCTCAGLATMLILTLLVFRGWTLDLAHVVGAALQHESKVATASE